MMEKQTTALYGLTGMLQQLLDGAAGAADGSAG